jgi:o-succinylbenzoate synthase
VTKLYAKVDVLEGELPTPLVGGGAGIARRSFAVLTLTRDDGTSGVGEASPLPGYSPDNLDDSAAALHALVDRPLVVDALASPFEIVSSVFEQHPLEEPSARFALETALLDWLGRNRGLPVHQVVGGDSERRPIPISDLVLASDPLAWVSEVERLIADGASHLKFKVGGDFESEVRALEEIRARHPEIPIRLDGNRKVEVTELNARADALEALGLEMFEEPVRQEDFVRALELPLPWALDETLLDIDGAMRLLETETIRCVVLKPTVLGGFRASLEIAERAAEFGAESTVSHTFDGPIARAATAEIALVLQCPRAVGLGMHPALDLWPPCDTAAIDGRRIVEHHEFGLGLSFEEAPDA